MFVNQDILFHDGTKQFCKYNEQQKTYSIILRANKGTVSSVFVCVNGNELQMTKIKTTEDFEYFEALLDAGEKMYQYYFKCDTNEDCIFYNMFGIMKQMIGRT